MPTFINVNYACQAPSIIGCISYDTQITNK